MTPDPDRTNHAASLDEAIHDQVLTGAAELLASALDLDRLEPSLHYHSAAEALSDAVCELVAAGNRRKCRRSACVEPSPATNEAAGDTNAPAPSPTPPREEARTTIGQITREQRDLLQSCLIQAAPALQKAARFLQFARVGAPIALRFSILDAMSHPGWHAAGISFPVHLLPPPRSADRTADPS